MSENDVAVSIIVPMYRVEKYIVKCLNSLQKQTFKNIEIIIVNDGSPDRSLEIAKEIASTDKRLRVINKENGGLSSGRNCGLEYANGKYIIFIDSDDFVERDYIENMYNLMEEKGLDISVSGIIVDFCEEGYQKIRCAPKTIIGNDKNEISRLIYKLDKLQLLNFAWNKMYKRELIKNNNLTFGINDMPAEDLVFNSKAFRKANSIGVLNKSYYHYMRRNVETIVSTFNPNLYNKIDYFNESRIDLYNYFELDTEVNKQLLYNNCFQYFKICIIDLFRPSCGYTKNEKLKMLQKIINSENFNFYFSYFNSESKFDQGLRKIISIGKVQYIYYYCKFFMDIRYKVIPVYKMIRKRKNKNENN